MSEGMQNSLRGPTIGTTDERSASLRHLHAATRRMMSAETSREIATVAVEAIDDVLGFRLNGVRLLDHAPTRLVPVAHTDDVVDLVGPCDPYHRDESLQWEALEAGEPRVYQDLSDATGPPEVEVNHSGEGSMLVCPIGDRGVLSMGTLDPDSINEEDVALSRILAANTEAALERAERERRLERKRERLDRFAGIVAHEFRNPITIAAGHLEYVDGADDDQRHIDATTRAVGRMDRLIDSLLDMVQGGELTGTTARVSVTDLTREVWDESPTLRGRLRCPDCVSVDADPERLRIIVENLLGNAVAHSGPDVTVTVGALDDSPGFYVADDGPGFDAAHPDRLFEYGATADADATGLGLAIVRDVAEAHGWEVSATLGDDGGARVEFHTDPDDV